MNRYLMLLGIVVIVFSVAGGSIELSASYNEYRSHVQALGGVTGTPLTAVDEVKWQLARLVGGAVIAGGLISGSMLMALAWIGKTMEQVRDALAGELAEAPGGDAEVAAKAVI